MPWHCSWNVFTFKPNHASNNLFRTTMEDAKEVPIVWQKPLVTWPAIIYNGILSCHTHGQKPRIKPSLFSLITTRYRLGGAHWFSGVLGPKRDSPQVICTPNNVKVIFHHPQFVAMLCSFWLVYWAPPTPTSTTSPQTTYAIMFPVWILTSLSYFYCQNIGWSHQNTVAQCVGLVDADHIPILDTPLLVRAVALLCLIIMGVTMALACVCMEIFSISNMIM